jgi:hypothetical protein
MEFLSIRQISEKWGISTRRIQILCAEGRITGAMRVGYSWVIPSDAEKPRDGRIKSGRYIGLAQNGQDASKE